MKKMIIPLTLTAVMAVGCGDNSSFSKVSKGFPQAVAAIPMKASSSVASTSFLFLKKNTETALKNFSNFLFPQAVAVNTPVTGDYIYNTPNTHLSEDTLDIATNINIFFDLLSQIPYNNPTLLGKGPFKAKVQFNDVGTPKTTIATVISEVGSCKGHDDAIIVKVWFTLDEGGAEVQPISLKACSFTASDELNPYGEWRMDITYDYQGGFGYAVAESRIVDGKTHLYLEDNETKRDTGITKPVRVHSIIDSESGYGIVRNDSGTISKYSFQGNNAAIYNSAGVQQTCYNRDPSLLTTYYAGYKVYDVNGLNVQRSRSITNESPLVFSTLAKTGASFTQFNGYTIDISNTSAQNYTNYWIMANNSTVSSTYNIPDGTALVGTDGNTYYLRPRNIVKVLATGTGCGSLTAPDMDFGGFDSYQNTGMDSVLPTMTTYRTSNSSPEATLKAEFGIVR